MVRTDNFHSGFLVSLHWNFARSLGLSIYLSGELNCSVMRIIEYTCIRVLGGGDAGGCELGSNQCG